MDNNRKEVRVIAHVVLVSGATADIRNELIPKLEGGIGSVLMDCARKARKRRRFLLELQFPSDGRPSCCNEEELDVTVSRTIEIVSNTELFIDLTESCEYLLHARDTLGLEEEEEEIPCRPEWWKRPRWSWAHHERLLAMGALLLRNVDGCRIGISSNKLLARLPYWCHHQSASRVTILDPQSDHTVIQSLLSSLPLTKLYKTKPSLGIQTISDLLQLPKCSLSFLEDLERLWQNAKGICHEPVMDNWKHWGTTFNATQNLSNKKIRLVNTYKTKKRQEPKLDSNGFDIHVWNQLPPNIRSELRIHANQQQRKKQQQQQQQTNKKRSPTLGPRRRTQRSSPITKWVVPQSRKKI